jgi:hypothetical protein
VYYFFKIFDAESERGLRRSELRAALPEAGLVLEEFQPFGYVGYALIANTGVLGLLRNFDDIVGGILRAIERPRAFGIYNLGTCETVTLRELITALEQALGKVAKLALQPGQPGDVPVTHADLTRATRELGYQRSIRIPEGLRRFVEWFRASQIPTSVTATRRG